MLKLLCPTLVVLAGCSSSFYGGVRVSPYVGRFNNQITCARVVGWAADSEVGCYCTIDKLEMSEDKVFIRAEDVMCQGE